MLDNEISNEHFRYFNLSEEQIHQLKELESKINEETNKPIYLLAYEKKMMK